MLGKLCKSHEYSYKAGLTEQSLSVDCICTGDKNSLTHCRPPTLGVTTKAVQLLKCLELERYSGASLAG